MGELKHSSDRSRSNRGQERGKKMEGKEKREGKVMEKGKAKRRVEEEYKSRRPIGH